MIEPLKHKISSHEELKERIAYLESLKDAQEDVLKMNLIRVHESLKPAELFRSAIETITSDADLNHHAQTASVNMGIDLLVGKMFKETESAGGFIKSTVTKQILHGLYNKYQDKINAFIGNITGKIVDFLSFETPEKESDKPEKEED